MKKKIIIITIVLVMNLFILACLNGRHAEEPTLEAPAIVGNPTFEVNEEEVEATVSIPSHPIPTLVPQTSEPSITNSENGSADPIEANQGIFCRVIPIMALAAVRHAVIMCLRKRNNEVR